jgi:hypothetical protein
MVKPCLDNSLLTVTAVMAGGEGTVELAARDRKVKTEVIVEEVEQVSGVKMMLPQVMAVTAAMVGWAARVAMVATGVTAALVPTSLFFTR